MSGPLMPAYVDAETGEAFIRVPGPVDRVRRQVDQYPDADTSYGAPAPVPVSFVFIFFFIPLSVSLIKGSFCLFKKGSFKSG